MNVKSSRGSDNHRQFMISLIALRISYGALIVCAFWVINQGFSGSTASSILRPFVITALVLAGICLILLLQELFIAHYSGAESQEEKSSVSYVRAVTVTALSFLPALCLIPAIGARPWLCLIATLGSLAVTFVEVDGSFIEP